MDVTSMLVQALAEAKPAFPGVAPLIQGFNITDVAERFAAKVIAAHAATDLAKACDDLDRCVERIESSATETRARIRAGVREPKGRFNL